MLHHTLDYLLRMSMRTDNGKAGIERLEPSSKKSVRAGTGRVCKPFNSEWEVSVLLPPSSSLRCVVCKPEQIYRRGS